MHEIKLYGPTHKSVWDRAQRWRLEAAQFMGPRIEGGVFVLTMSFASAAVADRVRAEAKR